jgi:hypothetical protein
VKALDYIFERFRRRSEEQLSARALLSRHLDPLLKAADDLVGKILSLSDIDFADFRKTPPKSQRDINSVRRLAALHLFVQFWARIQLLRLDSASVALGSSRAGAHLLNFLYELESKDVRVLDRAWQRAIGDASITHVEGVARPLNLHEFIKTYDTDNEYCRWIDPLGQILDRTAKAENRQKILVYGVVVHALIDTLDRKHVVTRKRRPWPNKLSNHSKNELSKRVFPVHLPFVKHAQNYTQDKK